MQTAENPDFISNLSSSSASTRTRSGCGSSVSRDRLASKSRSVSRSRSVPRNRSNSPKGSQISSDRYTIVINDAAPEVMDYVGVRCILNGISRSSIMAKASREKIAINPGELIYDTEGRQSTVTLELRDKGLLKRTMYSFLAKLNLFLLGERKGLKGRNEDMGLLDSQG